MTEIFFAWRAWLWSLLMFGATPFIIQPRAYNTSLANSPGNRTSLNAIVRCCPGLAGGYEFGGAYDSSRELEDEDTVVTYIKEVIPLLRAYGNFYPARGGEDIAHLLDFGDTTVSLKYIMDPPGSAILTYAQCAEALGYLLEALDRDIYTPEAIEYEIALQISVGKDQKILISVTQEEGTASHTEFGRNLEFNSNTYQARPMSRSGALASLAAAKAQYNQYVPPGSAARVVPEGFATSITTGGVRYQMMLELDETQKRFGWPRFTFADLIDLVGAIQHLLETTGGPSADSWAAFYADLETQRDGTVIGYVHVEPVNPGVHLLNAKNSTQPILSRPGNSGDASQVQVT